jgi:serine/threonine protein kinase
LPVGEALEICRHIAEGLEAAHERGVVHRDLKPANMKITPEGQAKILDFGLSVDTWLSGRWRSPEARSFPSRRHFRLMPGRYCGTLPRTAPTFCSAWDKV